MFVFDVFTVCPTYSRSNTEKQVYCCRNAAFAIIFSGTYLRWKKMTSSLVIKVDHSYTERGKLLKFK